MRAVGNQYEHLARLFLEDKGLTIITANYNVAKVGEIDLIAKQQVLRSTIYGTKPKDVLVFVEVKMRNKSQFGESALAVNHKKQQKIIKTAQYFLQDYGDAMGDMDCRFDVIAFDVDAHDVQVTWIQDAFFA